MRFLAVNPWIHDFAAFDYWMKPYGFLVLMEYLKKKGHDVEYIDMLESYEASADYGRKIFKAQEIDKPPVLNKVPRKFKRYGISLAEFNAKTDNKNFDAILLTSTMTYWYTGLSETYSCVREKFPDTPVYIGGNYPTLLPEHFKKNFPQAKGIASFNLEAFFKELNIVFEKKQFYNVMPDFHSFYKSPEYAVLRTTWGCSDNCPYCAVKKIFSSFFAVNNHLVIDFFKKHMSYGIKNFAFYDDALLFNKEVKKQLFKELIALKKDINLHSPNAMHLKFLDDELASLMKSVNFVMPRFGLETTDQDILVEWGDKVNREIVERAADNLLKAGYKKGEFAVYLLFGFNGQNINHLIDEVDWLNQLGFRVFFSEFSPVPGTIMGDKCSFAEPLISNNSVYGFLKNSNFIENWQLKSKIQKRQSEFFALTNPDIL